MPARQAGGAELAARFALEALIVNGARSRIFGADLARDLFAKGHAVDETGCSRERVASILRLRPAKPRRASAQDDRGRAKARPYITEAGHAGEAGAGDEAVACGVGWVVAFNFANVFDALIVPN